MDWNPLPLLKSDVCVTCLSNHRKLQPISSCDTLNQLCTTIWVDIQLSENCSICWECRAAITKIELFKKRALHAQTILLEENKKCLTEASLSAYLTVCAYQLSIKAAEHLGGTYDITENNVMKIEAHDDILITPSNSPLINAGDDIVKNENDDIVKYENVDNDDDVFFKDEPISFDLYDGNELTEDTKLEDNTTSNKDSFYEIKNLTEEDMWRHRERRKKSSQHKRAKYKCDDCIKCFNTDSSYNKHMRQHQMQGDFTCNICQMNFKVKKSLSKHISSHYVLYKCKLCKFTGDMSSVSVHYSRSHKEKQCKTCGERFKTRELYKQHSVLHAEKRTCELCGVKFSNEKFLKLHKHDESGAAYFECDICQKQFKKKERIWEHMKAHEHRDNAETYCVECGIHFSTKATYWAHINKTLKHASADDFKYKCPHCDKRFALQNVMQSHVDAMHEMSAEYYCEPCGKRYYSKSGLIRHKDNVHKGRVAPRNKICDVCEKAFTSNALLKQHRNTHFGIRQFECSLCPAAYVAHGALYNHVQRVHHHRKKVKPEDRVLKVHSKRWTLKCPHCEEYLRGTKLLESHISGVHKKSADYECHYCNKRFYGSVALQYHEDRHKSNTAGPRPKPAPARNKVCDVCDKAFFTNAVLNQHKNIHSGLRPFACASCPKTFNASGALYMHVAVVHEKVKTWRKRPRSTKATTTISEDLSHQ